MDDRTSGSGRRVGGWVLCRVGRHGWVTHHDPELPREEGAFELCRRCGRERQQYEAHHVADPSTSFGQGLGAAGSSF